MTTNLHSLTVGEKYVMHHSRKGVANVLVLAIDGEWIDVRIISGTVGVKSKKTAGDSLRVRDTFATFSPIVQPETNGVNVILGEYLFEFRTFSTWVNKAASWFTSRGLRAHDVLCVDALGRICDVGKQFQRADADNAFPIRVYRKVY